MNCNMPEFSLQCAVRLKRLPNNSRKVIKRLNKSELDRRLLYRDQNHVDVVAGNKYLTRSNHTVSKYITTDWMVALAGKLGGIKRAAHRSNEENKSISTKYQCCCETFSGKTSAAHRPALQKLETSPVIGQIIKIPLQYVIETSNF